MVYKAAKKAEIKNVFLTFFYSKLFIKSENVTFMLHPVYGLR